MQSCRLRITILALGAAVLGGCLEAETLGRIDLPETPATPKESVLMRSINRVAELLNKSMSGDMTAAPVAAPAAAVSRVKVQGQEIQGGLVRVRVEPGSRVWVRGYPYPVSSDGSFLIGFGRNAPPKATMRVKFPDDTEEELVFDVEQREYATEIINHLPQHMVKLEGERKTAHRRAHARVKRARKRFSQRPFYEGGFVWPVKGPVTSVYGSKRILNGQERSPHWGVDVAAAVGTKVHAPAAGVVVFAERHVPLAGHLLIIDHGHGLTSSFLHLSHFDVKVGDEVEQSQLIGRVGATGRVTGAHLDWRMNLFSRRIDPALLVVDPDKS